MNSVQRCQRRVPKCLDQSEARGHLVFLIGWKNKNLVEDIEILVPVKFRLILFRGFRGVVGNVSANQCRGKSGHLVFHKLGRGR